MAAIESGVMHGSGESGPCNAAFTPAAGGGPDQFLRSPCILGELGMRSIFQLALVSCAVTLGSFAVAGCGSSNSAKDHMAADKMSGDKMNGGMMSSDKMGMENMSTNKMGSEKM